MFEERFFLLLPAEPVYCPPPASSPPARGRAWRRTFRWPGNAKIHYVANVIVDANFISKCNRRPQFPESHTTKNEVLENTISHV